MATDPVLQWRTHVTDSTDQDTILGNLDILEQFAISINGGDDYTIGEVKGLFSEQFNNIRKGIKDGTIKPTEWKSSKELGNITTALTNASSGKISTLTEQLGNVKTLLNNEVSHWTAETTPAPLAYTPTAKVKASTQPWGKDEDPERHADDLCTVIGEEETDKGVSYRFIKHPTDDSYKWLKVIDNDGVLALSKQSEFEVAYNSRQEAIDNALDNKQRKGNYVEKTNFDENNTKVAQEIQELKGTYKVTVTTQGEIRNGEIIGGTTHDSKPAILHTAHVYGILGNKITDTEIINKLTWTVNSGRTTKPEQRTVTGATCYVTADDFVRVLSTQGSTPQYYDIELNSNF